MPVDREDIRRALVRKGFVEEPRDHYFYTFWVEGKRTPIFTKLSHSPKYRTYGDHLIGLMCRQLGLTNREFGDLVRCPLSQGEYVALLRDRGRLRR